MSGRATSPEAAFSLTDESNESDAMSGQRVHAGRIKPIHKNYHFQPDAGMRTDADVEIIEATSSPTKGYRMVRTLPELMNEARSRKLARLRTMRTAGADILQQENLARKAIDSQFLSFWATEIAPEFAAKTQVARQGTLRRLEQELEEIWQAAIGSNSSEAIELPPGRRTWEWAALGMLSVLTQCSGTHSELLIAEEEEWSVIHDAGEAAKSRLDRAAMKITDFIRKVGNRKRLKSTLEDQKYTIQGMDLAAIVTNLVHSTKKRLVFRARRGLLRGAMSEMRSLYISQWYNERLTIAAESFSEMYALLQEQQWSSILQDISRDVVAVESPLVLRQQDIDEFNARCDLLVDQYTDLWTINYQKDETALYLKAVLAQEGMLRRHLEVQAAAGVDIDQYFALLKILPWWLARSKRNKRERIHSLNEKQELRNYSSSLIQTAWRCRLARRSRRIELLDRDEMHDRGVLSNEELQLRECIQRVILCEEGVIFRPEALSRLNVEFLNQNQQESLVRQLIEDLAELSFQGKGISPDSIALIQTKAASTLHLHCGRLLEGYRVRKNLAPTLTLLSVARQRAEALGIENGLLFDEMDSRARIERGADANLTVFAAQCQSQSDLLSEALKTKWVTIYYPEIIAFEALLRNEATNRFTLLLSSVFTASGHLARIAQGAFSRRRLGKRRCLTQGERSDRITIEQAQVLEFFGDILQPRALDEHSQICFSASRQFAKAVALNFADRSKQIVEVDEPAGRLDIQAAEDRWMSLTLLESDAVLKTLRRLAQEAREDEDRMVAETKSRKEFAELSSKLFEVQSKQDHSRFDIVDRESSARSALLLTFRDDFQALLQKEMQAATQKLVRPTSPPLSDSRRSSESPFRHGANAYAHQLALQQLAVKLEEEEDEGRQKIYREVDYSAIVAQYKEMKKSVRGLLMKRATVLAGLEAKVKKLQSVMEPTIRGSIQESWKDDKGWEELQDMAKLTETLLRMNEDGQRRLLKGPVAEQPSDHLEVLSNEAISEQAMTTSPSSMGPAERKNSGMSNSSGVMIPMLPSTNAQTSGMAELEKAEEQARKELIDSVEGSSSYQALLVTHTTILATLKQPSPVEVSAKLPKGIALKINAEESAARQEIMDSIESSASYQQIALFADYVQAAQEDEYAEDEEEVYVVEEVEGEEEEEESESSDDDRDSMASVGSILWV